MSCEESVEPFSFHRNKQRIEAELSCCGFFFTEI